MRLSWTSYNSLENCGLQFDLKYDKKIRMPQNQKVFLVGRVVHDSIGAWVKAGYPALDSIRPDIEARLIKEFTRFQLSDDEMQKYADRAVTGAMTTARLYKLLEFGTHGSIVEEWFDVGLPNSRGHRLHGAADVYDPIRATIFDLKLYSSGGSGDLRQLLTYAVAFRALGRPVKEVGFIYPLRVKKKLETVSISEADIDRQQASLVAATLRIDNKQYGQATKGDYCRFCEYFKTQHCPTTAAQVPELPPGNTVILGRHLN